MRPMLLALIATVVAFAGSSPRSTVASPGASPYDSVRFLTGGTGHRPDSKYDSTKSTVVSMGSLKSIVLTVQTIDGKTYTRRFHGGEIDALFFTMPAVEKFVVPYYAKQFGDSAGERVHHGALRAFEKGTR